MLSRLNKPITNWLNIQDYYLVVEALKYVCLRLFGCCWIYLNQHVLRWIRTKFSLNSTQIHLNICGLIAVWASTA